MSQFDNVTVETAANIYFDGNVTSRTVHFSDGSRKTLGIMLPGEYEFGTSENEMMDILSGTLEFQLPDSDWQSIQGRGKFEVPANCKFQVKVIEVTDYCCSYA